MEPNNTLSAYASRVRVHGSLQKTVDSQFLRLRSISHPGGWCGRGARQPGQVRKEAAVTNPLRVVPASHLSPTTATKTARGRLALAIVSLHPTLRSDERRTIPGA